MAIRKINSRSLVDDAIATADIADGSISTAKLADDAVTTPKVAGTVNLGRRNMIVNGAMRIAQRGTTESVDTAQSPRTVDRFRYVGGFSGFTATGTQDGASTPSGFTHAYKLEVTSTLGTTSSGLYSSLLYLVEGYDHSRLRWGYADAQSATFSFYVKSSVTGQYGINFTNGTINYLTSYTINTANTWERKVITIPAVTTGAWSTTNGVALYIRWDLGVGSVYESSTTEDWTLTGNIWGLTGGVKLFETNGAVFSITGVQMEVGDTATPFEHLTYAEDLVNCQRYLYSATNGATGYIAPFWQYNNNANLNAFLKFPTTMRAEPTIVHNASTSNYFIGYAAGQGLSWTTLTLNEQTLDSAVIYNNQYSSYGSGACGGLYVGSASAFLWMDAEL